jgi:HD-GYP domain-containing protein (c-di-GMP phosphodiesterase class II)
MDASNGHVTAVRQALAAEVYEVDPHAVAAAILRRLIELNLTMGDARLARAIARTLVGDDAGRPAGHGNGSTRRQLEVATARPSLQDLASAQLQRYAVDLRHSYERELQRTRELEERSLATVRALAAAVAERDDDTGNHIQRVHDLGLLLAHAVIPDEADDPELAYGFILHDIGKVAVPDAVLRKPGPLDDAEWELMRSHPEAGARMLDGVPFLSRAREVVLHHHERWDGGGYPHGLAGEQIPIWARVFAVVDAVDAMTSYRPYRAGLPLEKALAEVAHDSGSQFDPKCAASFLSLDRGEVAELLQPAEENRLETLVA